MLPTEFIAKTEQTGWMVRLTKSSLCAHFLCRFCHVVGHLDSAWGKFYVIELPLIIITYHYCVVFAVSILVCLMHKIM